MDKPKPLNAQIAKAEQMLKDVNRNKEQRATMEADLAQAREILRKWKKEFHIKNGRKATNPDVESDPHVALVFEEFCLKRAVLARPSAAEAEPKKIQSVMIPKPSSSTSPAHPMTLTNPTPSQRQAAANPNLADLRKELQCKSRSQLLDMFSKLHLSKYLTKTKIIERALKHKLTTEQPKNEGEESSDKVSQGQDDISTDPRVLSAKALIDNDVQSFELLTEPENVLAAEPKETPPSTPGPSKQKAQQLFVSCVVEDVGVKLRKERDDYEKSLGDWIVDFRGTTGKAPTEGQINRDQEISKILKKLRWTERVIAQMESNAAGNKCFDLQTNQKSKPGTSTEDASAERKSVRKTNPPTPFVSEAKLPTKITKKRAAPPEWEVDAVDGMTSILAKNPKKLCPDNLGKALVGWRQTPEPVEFTSHTPELWDEMVNACLNGEARIILTQDESYSPPEQNITLMPLTREFKAHVYRKMKEYYVCYICVMVFGTKGDMKQHCKSHLNEEEHKCLACGQFFSSAKTLAAHVAHLTCATRVSPILLKLKLKDLGVGQKVDRFNRCFEHFRNQINKQMVAWKSDNLDTAEIMFSGRTSRAKFNKVKKV